MPVRKSHRLVMPWAAEYALTSATLVAIGLASIPISWTPKACVPSIPMAWSMLVVVSGQIEVHSESTKARTTTFPRNWLSDTGLPNWLERVKFGAGCPWRGVPGSMFRLIAPADELFDVVVAEVESTPRSSPASTTATIARAPRTANAHAGGRPRERPEPLSAGAEPAPSISRATLLDDRRGVAPAGGVEVGPLMRRPVAGIGG